MLLFIYHVCSTLKLPAVYELVFMIFIVLSEIFLHAKTYVFEHIDYIWWI